MKLTQKCIFTEKGQKSMFLGEGVNIFCLKIAQQISLASQMLIPRVIRAKDAPSYLGMDRNRFNQEVKPYLISVPIGTQGVGYDRLDLDNWWEDFKRTNGIHGKFYLDGKKQWEEKEAQVCVGDQISQAVFGTSKKSSTAMQFTKAVEQATKKKQKDI
jgi:hypothetical protein